MIGQASLTAVARTKKSAEYLVLPHKTSTSLTMPIGQLVSLLAS